MASPHLQVPDIQASQNQKEVTHNAAIALLDRALNQLVQKTITGSDSLDQAEYRENAVVELTGTPGGAFDLDMFDANERVLTVINNTDSVGTLRNSSAGGTGFPVLGVGEVAEFHTDGTDATIKFSVRIRSRWVGADEMFLPINSPAAAAATAQNTSGNAELRTIDFDSATQENAMFALAMPRTWSLGDIVGDVHYSHNGGQTGGLDGVVWGFTAVAVADAGSLNVAFGAEVLGTSDQAAADTLFIVPIAITISGSPAADELTTFQVARKVGNAADDLDIDARLHGVNLFWLEAA